MTMSLGKGLKGQGQAIMVLVKVAIKAIKDIKAIMAIKVIKNMVTKVMVIMVMVMIKAKLDQGSRPTQVSLYISLATAYIFHLQPVLML